MKKTKTLNPNKANPGNIISPLRIDIKTEGLPLKSFTKFVEFQGELKSLDDEQFNRLKSNILKNGFIAPLFLWQDNLIDGHQRLKVLKQLYSEGYRFFSNGVCVNDQIPYITITAKTKEEAGKFILSYSSQFGQITGLTQFLEDFKLNWADIDSQIFLSNIVDKDSVFGKPNNALREHWIMPPFSILDSRTSYWLNRRELWDNLFGVYSTRTRQHALANNNILSQINEGTSVFDPVLAEIIFHWFTPANGKILNLFAGGVEPNIVAGYRDYRITGVELRSDQVSVTNNAAMALKIQNNVRMICGDVMDLNKLVPDKDFDSLFSCFPYYDLEHYSDSDKDFANMSPTQFDNLMQVAITNGCAKLKNNRFAVCVVSEVRDPSGVYRSLIPKTITWFNNAGLQYYNEIILINSAGTLPIRINNMWQNKKIGRMHQNVLVFYKGDIKEIKSLGGNNPDTFLGRWESKQSIDVNQKVLVFYKGDIAKIKEEFAADPSKEILSF